MAAGPDDTHAPVSDPTALTTERLQREIGALRELIEARMSGMDRAAELLHANATRIPTDTDRQVGHLKELNSERFAGIQKQFEERDIRSRAAEDAAKVAVNAALQAQKEAAAAQNEANGSAIAKSEVAFTKQIDGILALINSNFNAINDKITALNARLDRGEGVVRGGELTRTEKRQDNGLAVGIISLGVTLLVAFAGVIIFVVNR